MSSKEFPPSKSVDPGLAVASGSFKGGNGILGVENWSLLSEPVGPRVGGSMIPVFGLTCWSEFLAGLSSSWLEFLLLFLELVLGKLDLLDVGFMELAPAIEFVCI